MRQQYWPILLFGSTLAIRLIGIGAESLWYDEAFTAQLAQLPLPRLIQATAGDVHPPAWYLITWVATKLIGHSELALRVPAALFSASCVTELYLLIKKTTDHRSALWAAGLSMVAGGMQYYGQEARQYSFLTWLVLTSLRSVLEDRKWRFAPAIALSLYTQNLSIIYIVPLAVLAVWKWRKQALLPLAFAGVSYLPWLGVLISQLSDISSSYWIAQGNIGGTLYYWLYGTLGNRLPGWAMFHSIATAIGVTIAALFAMRGQFKKYLPLLAITFVPPLELFAVSQVFQPLMLPRALLPSSAGILALWGMGISRMSKQARRFALIFLVPVMAIAMINYFTNPQARRAPASDQTEIIRGNWREGDVIYHASVGSVVGYGYYLPEYDYYLMPDGDEIGGLSPLTRSALGYTEHEASIDAVAAHGYQRAFLIWSQSATISDQQVARATAITTDYKIIDSWTLVDHKHAGYRIYLIDLEGAYGSAH